MTLTGKWVLKHHGNWGCSHQQVTEEIFQGRGWEGGILRQSWRVPYSLQSKWFTYRYSPVGGKKKNHKSDTCPTPNFPDEHLGRTKWSQRWKGQEWLAPSHPLAHPHPHSPLPWFVSAPSYLFRAENIFLGQETKPWKAVLRAKSVRAVVPRCRQRLLPAYSVAKSQMRAAMIWGPVSDWVVLAPCTSL